ncbi:hypothetical protein ACJJTC_003832 [Scirpophaga incertulas]
MSILWGVIFVALAGSHFGYGLPIGSTPQTKTYDAGSTPDNTWIPQEELYATVPAVALLITVVGFLLGCTWCYRHKDCKPNRGANDQLFTAAVTHLQDVRRSNQPDSGFSEPVVSGPVAGEDNNNGPISLRELQNIANNNAAAYITSGNEERTRLSRESVVEFEPLPVGIGTADPLERHASWFGGEDSPRNQLQYLREIGRGWFGRVVEGEIDEAGMTSTVAVKILNQNASLEDKARFLEESRLYRDVRHENILGFIAKCLNEDPWIVIFELCPMSLQQYLIENSPKMATLNDSGVPLRLICDVTSALSYLHTRGHLYGHVWTESVMVRGASDQPRALLGSYTNAAPPADLIAPETRRNPAAQTASSEVWSTGCLAWQVCAWGQPLPTGEEPPPPPLPCPYRNHLYQVMQLCWHTNPGSRPTSSQVHALVHHLYSTQTQSNNTADDGYGSSDFEMRWQRLKPNTIPIIDEHVAIVHAPCTSPPIEQNLNPSTPSLSVDVTVSRSSSIMSDKDPLSIQIKSESLTNLHGSLEDVRNIYLTHNEMAVLECHQGNICIEDKEDRSDSSMDPWLKDIIAGSQDDVSYYKDVSDVIKNLDNILNSEKTSSSESSHQASPSRDNLSLDCKKEYPMQSSMVKSPGISNFQNIMESALDSKSYENETLDDDDADRDTIGTLSHSFERHSDTTSQQTLENVTPETPVKDLVIVGKIVCENETVVKDTLDIESDSCIEMEVNTPLPEKTDLPNDNKLVCSVSQIPKLKELCVASMPSVSDSKIQIMSITTQDCKTSCDNKLTEERTDGEEIETKSIDIKVKSEIEKEAIRQFDEVQNVNKVELDNLEIILPNIVNAITLDTVNIDNVTTLSEQSSILNDDDKNGEVTTKDELDETEIRNEIVVSDEAISTSDNQIYLDAQVSSKNIESNIYKEDDCKNGTDSLNDHEPEAPESVQNNINNKIIDTTLSPKIECSFSEIVCDAIVPPELSPEIVQNTNNEVSEGELRDKNTDSDLDNTVVEITVPTELNTTEKLGNGNVYMDLINVTNSEIMDQTVDDNIKQVIKSCLDSSHSDDECIFMNNESTAYMDLPSLVKEVDNFLNSERTHNSYNKEIVNICSSTPIGSDRSNGETIENFEKNIVNDLSVTKIPESHPGVSKIEQRYVTENLSPLDSPTKSHHTDTYDENSSVVLGPFENSSIEYFKGIKCGEIDIPKEELLAFSSNFSEINLETPSPLRDGRFLNEVPDILQDDIQFDDIETISEIKLQSNGSQVESPIESSSNETNCQSGTEKRVSPLTPPNSPGNFLVSTVLPQHNYIVDIYNDPPAGPSHAVDPVFTGETDLNQIELQITAKLAMAENENNLNIEYSRPLIVDALPEDRLTMSNTEPEEVYLAGNGSTSPRPVVELDEECVKALRNELELKLPLAQVSNIEPASAAEWGGSLPPPPELVLSYPGALSPIAEETRQQLSAYENDAHWSACSGTASSEYYPEPCADSLDRTYTLRRDTSSAQQITMSADSLNASPCKKALNEYVIDDKTFTINEDEKESNCERISQVTPCILSPTDTSAPDNSDNVDNATGVSTLSKTTVATDAKSSKPSETQCLSKTTSIDSWCSNDTLYNVEENFEDLAMDPEVPLDFEQKADDRSDSSRTLTHNDDDKDLSHCSTYIVHDSKSEACDTFSPDSITANDNYTYTKARTEVAGATPSFLTKSEVDSAKTTQTKDLAYGTLMSGLSYSNCTTEAASAFEDVWKVKPPELVRRSPMADDINMSPPKIGEECQDSFDIIESPQISTQPSIKKEESVEISCFNDNLLDSPDRSDNSVNRNLVIDIEESPDNLYKDMAPSVTSTPITNILVNEDVEFIPTTLSCDDSNSPIFTDSIIPNFKIFMQSAEIRPQDISTDDSYVVNKQDTEISKEGSSNSNKVSTRETLSVNERTPNYSDFESSVIVKPQDVYSTEISSQSTECGMNSDEFRNFENSVKHCPQDLSSIIDASFLLLNSERKFSEMESNPPCAILEQTNQSERINDCAPMKSLNTSPPNFTNLIESQQVDRLGLPSQALTDLDEEEIETDQPHSMIFTENDVLIKESPNRTFDSHTEIMQAEMHHTYDSHETICKNEGNITSENDDLDSTNINVNDTTHCNENMANEDVLLKSNDSSKLNLSFKEEKIIDNTDALHTSKSPGEVSNDAIDNVKQITCNGANENYATVSFLNEPFEELLESNVDEDHKDLPNHINETSQQINKTATNIVNNSIEKSLDIPSENSPRTVEERVESTDLPKTNGIHELDDENLTDVTENFLQNEKIFCQLNSYLPLLGDIRFTGPASEIMSTSFTQNSPTSPNSPDTERERDDKQNIASDILKDWDSDSDSHSTNSSSGEFIWKQRENGASTGGENGAAEGGGAASSGDSGSGSGSGSEGDEVEFVPSSWDCRAAPAKSSLRSLEHPTPDNKKRVVFKRQKYHSVYEYPREVADVDTHSPAYMPDLSTYSDWDPTSVEEAELGYGQLFGSPNPLDLYPLRSGIAYDYDDDFFISSSARPFESLGIMSTTSQFFPGMHAKGLLDRPVADEIDDFPPPPSPLPITTALATTATTIQNRAPSLDLTTPDSGVEDITPGSTSADEEFKSKKLPESDVASCWRTIESGSSSESVSPSSPGGEALGGLRHTRDKLKLDLPPSPCVPSPRHSRVFNFVLDKPRRVRQDSGSPDVATSSVDPTPYVCAAPDPEPTFSTFGKAAPRSEPEHRAIILTDETPPPPPPPPKATAADSGDEDSGIESSKATLERNKSTPNVS